MTEMSALLSVTQVAELHEVPARIVRKAARKGEIPGQIQVLGKYWGFDPDLVKTWKPPATGTFGPRTKREDGRSWYRIALNTEEHATLAATYEVVDPRVAAKARRVARKAAKAEGADADVAQEPDETAAEGDPFADFGD